MMSFKKITSINFIYEFKSNKEEIGIYKSLGGKFINISKVLFIDVLFMGLLISILSLFITPIVMNLSNKLIISSFREVLDIVMVNMDIIKIYPKLLVINYAALNFLIIISAIIPIILLLKLKPIEIIKG